MKIAFLVFAAALLTTPGARAQARQEVSQPGSDPDPVVVHDANGDLQPGQGSEEIQTWSASGHSAFNGASRIGVWEFGVRYGLILTDPHGPGFLRGRLEYAVDAVPVYVIFQPRGPVYGAGVNPFAFKWMLSTPRRVTPYCEFGGGVVFTDSDVPSGISRINFDSGPAVGVNIGHGRKYWSLEARWLHISDAGLTADNPGINTIQFRVGIGWFRHKE